MAKLTCINTDALFEQVSASYNDPDAPNERATLTNPRSK